MFGPVEEKKNVNVVISRNKWETLSTLLGTLGSCVKPDQVVSVNGNSSNMSSKDNLCSYITDHTMLYNFKFVAEWQRSRKSCHPPLFVFNLFYIKKKTKKKTGKASGFGVMSQNCTFGSFNHQITSATTHLGIVTACGLQQQWQQGHKPLTDQTENFAMC